MNERIKELSRQSADYANTYSDVGADVWFEIYNKKFAELIIRECVEICDNTTGTSYLNGWYAGKQIRKHFGVEE